MLPNDKTFRTVLAVILTLGCVAIFAVADPLLKGVLLLVTVFGLYFTWQASRK